MTKNRAKNQKLKQEIKFASCFKKKCLKWEIIEAFLVPVLTNDDKETI